MSEKLELQAKLIAALAGTMTDQLWATEILARCGQIEEALKHIRRIASERVESER